jgi:hypothetical protein
MWWLAFFTGALETKVRPAVVIASDTYLAAQPDVLVGILTTKLPRPLSVGDHILLDWRSAGLRAESCFRAYFLTMHRSQLTGNWSSEHAGLGFRQGSRLCGVCSVWSVALINHAAQTGILR